MPRGGTAIETHENNVFYSGARGYRVEIYEQSGAMYLRSWGDYLRLIYNRGARITSVVILRPGVSRASLPSPREFLATENAISLKCLAVCSNVIA